MGKRLNPRHGSMQVWPRKRAKRQYTRVRSWADTKDVVPLGFAGYKVGMTHVGYTDNVKTSVTKGREVASPVTIIECPPLKVCGARAYKRVLYATKVVAQTMLAADKDLAKKVNQKPSDSQKVPKIDAIDAANVDRVVLVCYTQPKLTSIGKKKPELFEVAIGGSVEEQLNYAKENVGKELSVKDVFQAGTIVDIHSVTKGYGTQGPVKRFGVNLRQKKSEKGTRAPGSISGGWTSQMHMMYRVAYAGQTGYHTRTEYNKPLILIEDDATKVNPKGGFIRYGEVKNTYVLIKGSVGGSRKRLIRFNKAIRSEKEKIEAPALDYISLESKQN